MDEFTFPFINSNTPRPEKPNNVPPIDRQIICLAFDAKVFLDMNNKTAIPSMSIEVLLAKTKDVTDGSNPRSFTNESEKKNRCENK